MDNQSLPLGAVSVQYDDYVGSAAADDADALAQTPSLYQIVGLDREQWMILSVEMSSSKQSERVSVYAIDRLRYQVSTVADVRKLGEAPGGLSVVAFDLPDTVDVHQFIAAAFQRISIRLVSTGVQGLSLNVVGRRALEGPAL